MVAHDVPEGVRHTVMKLRAKPRQLGVSSCSACGDDFPPHGLKCRNCGNSKLAQGAQRRSVKARKKRRAAAAAGGHTTGVCSCHECVVRLIVAVLEQKQARVGTESTGPHRSERARCEDSMMLLVCNG